MHRSVQGIGQFKALPTGRRLALAAGTINPQQTLGAPSVELLDFDPATGRLTNPVGGCCRTPSYSLVAVRGSTLSRGNAN